MLIKLIIFGISVFILVVLAAAPMRKKTKFSGTWQGLLSGDLNGSWIMEIEDDFSIRGTVFLNDQHIIISGSVDYAGNITVSSDFISLTGCIVNQEINGSWSANEYTGKWHTSRLQL